MTLNKTAPNSNIKFIQLKLNEFSDFDYVLEKRTHSSISSNNGVQDVIIKDDDYYEYDSPVCPECGSNKIIKQGNRSRIVNFPNSYKHEIFLKKYQCTNCGKYFQTELNGLLDKFKNYTNDFKDNVHEILKKGHQKCRNLTHIFDILWESAPSHQTMKNWIKRGENKRIKNNIGIFSGYYAYDEEYLSLSGKKAYRLTLFDSIFNYPVTEQISYNLKSETIKEFLEYSLENIPVECISTDLMPKYKNIMDEIDVNHQLCIFHFMQAVTKIREKELKKYLDDEVEQERIRKECSDLQDIFRAKNLNECINWYILFLDHLTPDREYIYTFVEKNVKKNFLNLIQHYFDPLQERTNNKIETYFKQTDPDDIKKKYKTASGLLDFLYIKMEYMTEKSVKELDENYLTNF